MTTVYLHIGLSKTGTTAVQNFLTGNDEVLKSHGICYPDLDLRYRAASWRRNAHFLIKEDPTLSGGEYGIAFDKITELGKKYDKIFLSDEALWGHGGKNPDFWPRVKADFDKRGFDLRIIVYLRRQDSFVQSLYCQKIKSASTALSFADYMSELEAEYPLDFLTHMDALADVVGKENLIIRVYENGQYEGAEHNIFSDFLGIFGLSLSDGFKLKKEIYNVSLDGSWLEMHRLLNSLPDKIDDSSALYKSIHAVHYHNPLVPKSTKKYSLFDPDAQAAFLERYEESNSGIATKYLGREDGKLFYETANDLPEYQIDTEELLQNTILVYGRAIELLDQKNKELQKRLKKLEQDLQEVQKNVQGNNFWYRLKRKIKHISGRDR